MFARIDERAHQAYPGLALVVISGARPVALRRVNYYEDFQFMGLFDPPRITPIRRRSSLRSKAGRSGCRWLITACSSAAGRLTPGRSRRRRMKAPWSSKRRTNTVPAHIRVPRAGKITAVDGRTGGDVPDGPLFSLMYYEDGAGLIDPFAEVRAFCEQVRAELKAKQREEDERRRAAER